MSLASIVINDGLSDINKNKNPYGVARRLMQNIISLIYYETVFDEIKAGVIRDYRNDLPGYEFDRGIVFAAWGGHRPLIKYFLDNANYLPLVYNNGMVGAARGGYLDLVKDFIDKGGDEWQFSITDAALYGHKDIVEYLLHRHRNCVNWALYGAARGGHKDIIQFCIANSARIWQFGFDGAFQSGNKELMEYFISKNNELRNLLSDERYIKGNYYSMNRIKVECIK